MNFINGPLLGQMDEAFWVSGSSGSLSVTQLQRCFSYVYDSDFIATSDNWLPVSNIFIGKLNSKFREQ